MDCRPRKLQDLDVRDEELCSQYRETRPGVPHSGPSRDLFILPSQLFIIIPPPLIVVSDIPLHNQVVYPWQVWCGL